MKGTIKRIVEIAGILAVLCALPAWAAGDAGGEQPLGPGWEAPAGQNEAEVEADLPSWLTPETEHVVVVIADETGSSRAMVTYYKKEDGWNEVFSVRGIVGKSGLASPEKKREGDKKTPAGVYDFIKAFGIKEDPGSIMEYHKISQGDVGVDDSARIHYNRMVNSSETEKDWNSAENLAAMAPWYDYCLALSYNEEQTAGKGSAIFLHCLREDDWGTSGCIGIPEQNMEVLLQNLNANSKILIKSEK